MQAMNDNRPPAFDSALLAYRPGMRRLASKLGYRGAEADDLVTDTIAYCLEHWTNFRGEQSKMWNWIYWQMRGIVANRRVKKSISIVDSTVRYENASVFGNQTHSAELNHVVAALSGRSGEMTLRLAMGDTLEEIGRDYGVGRERVRQLVEKERGRVRAILEAA